MQYYTEIIYLCGYAKSVLAHDKVSTNNHYMYINEVPGNNNFIILYSRYNQFPIKYQQIYTICFTFNNFIVLK